MLDFGRSRPIPSRLVFFCCPFTFYDSVPTSILPRELSAMASGTPAEAEAQMKALIQATDDSFSVTIAAGWNIIQIFSPCPFTYVGLAAAAALTWVVYDVLLMVSDEVSL